MATKKKKGTRNKTIQQAKLESIHEGNNLKRFAGSSDEEENNSEDDVTIKKVTQEKNYQSHPKTLHSTTVLDDEPCQVSEVEENDLKEKDEDKDILAPESSDGEEDNDNEKLSTKDDSNESDKDDDIDRASGMASAMTRILGTVPKKGTRSMVLCKTVTPLQRLQQQEHEREAEACKKRKANRERNLTAMHIPLSVATTATTLGKADTEEIDMQVTTSTNSLVLELEQERTHRRVATRGVVALFNAISQHQSNSVNAASDSGVVSKDSKEVQKLTKHGFLDRIKAAAKETNSSTTEEQSQTLNKPKWNALQDDYMLNSKLKDWDKESSDEDDEDAAQDTVDDTWDESIDAEKAEGSSIKKKNLMKNESSKTKTTRSKTKSKTGGKRKR
jgi:Rrp15p